MLLGRSARQEPTPETETFPSRARLNRPDPGASQSGCTAHSRAGLLVRIRPDTGHRSAVANTPRVRERSRPDPELAQIDGSGGEKGSKRVNRGEP